MSYGVYGDELVHAFDPNLHLESCAYCGETKEGGLVSSCPTCSRNNCRQCMETFGLAKVICTDGGLFCPLPRLCAAKVNVEKGVFGTFGNAGHGKKRYAMFPKH
jgi:hypothetical protein